MKSIITAATFGIGLAMSGVAHAADLTPEEQGYITVALNTLSVTNLCGGYSFVAGSLAKLGDQLGVDNKIGIAAFETLKMDMGSNDYDRSVLIPDVTRFVHNIEDAMVHVTKDKANYCRQFVPVLLQRGTIAKKGAVE